MSFTCQFCGRESTNKGANKKHENGCSHNPAPIKYYRSPKSGRQKGKKYFVWNRGLTKETSSTLAEQSKQRMGARTGRSTITERGREALRRKARKNILERYKSGWEPVAGRCPKYDYTSPIAGHIKVDGSWELTFCEYADANNLSWCRNTKRFPYIKPNGQHATYQPDFYVYDWELYIEVKGYETELDHYKWKQFPEKIEIYRKREINQLKLWIKEQRKVT